MNPLVWSQTVEHFAQLVEKEAIEPKIIESFTRDCFAQITKGDPLVAPALSKLAKAIKAQHPDLNSLIADIEVVAQSQGIANSRHIPFDLEKMMLTPLQRRGLNKSHQAEIDKHYLEKLLKLEPLLPMGFFPWVARNPKTQEVINPLKQWTLLSKLILKIARLEPGFTETAKEFEERGGKALTEPEILGNLGKWVAMQNRARFQAELDLEWEPSQLNLKGAYLTLLPPELWTLKNIEQLSLKDNPISFIPPEILFLGKLKVLDCSGTSIEELPRPMRHLPLQGLSIANCPLQTLPPWLFEMRSLRLLNLEGLGLTFLPLMIGNLHHLSSLSLDGNQLNNLPHELVNLNLEHLSISDNLFTQPPAVISQLHHLISLSCRGLDPEIVRKMTKAKVSTE